MDDGLKQALETRKSVNTALMWGLMTSTLTAGLGVHRTELFGLPKRLKKDPRGYVAHVELMRQDGTLLEVDLPIVSDSISKPAAELSRTDKQRLRKFVRSDQPQLFMQKWKNIYICFKDPEDVSKYKAKLRMKR